MAMDSGDRAWVSRWRSNPARFGLKNMQRDLKIKVADYYGQKVTEFGTAAKGVDWKDEGSQNLRFDQLLKVTGQDKKFSLNDLGCGYGAICLYQELAPRLTRYYGYDIAEEMLVKARKLVKDKRAEFINSDLITREADYSIASGIFNVKLDTEEKVWQDFIIRTLTNMDEKSIKGFAFNCMTTYVDYRVDHLYYADPLFFFDLCKKKFSKYVTLIHDYKLYEWTILVKK
jgi:SAM-dependent methyltransferase